MVYCKYIKMLKKLLMESGISLLTISPEETSSYTWAATLPDNQERHAQQWLINYIQTLGYSDSSPAATYIYVKASSGGIGMTSGRICTEL